MAVALLFILYCLEAGIFFLVVPWTRFWGLNPLLHANAELGLIMDSAWIRGLVSGIGVIHLLVGAREVGDLVLRYFGSDERGR